MKNILILEDNEDLAHGLEDVIRDVLGARVFVTTSGNEAIEAVRNDVIDLCLMDVNLPDQNGVSVLSVLRSEGLTFSSLFMTGYRWPQVVSEVFPETKAHYIADADPVTLAQWLRADEHSDSLVFALAGQEVDLSGIRQLAARQGYHLLERCDYGVEVPAQCKGLVYLCDDYLVNVLAHLVYLRKEGFNKDVLVIRSQPSNAESRTFSSYELTGCMFKPFDLMAFIGLIEKSLG